MIYPATDGMQIHGQLFCRPAAPATKPPALVFFHGGSRRQMLLGWHYMYYYYNAYAMNQYLASRAMSCCRVNYRSGIGYGLNFREAVNYGATRRQRVQRCDGAGLYMRTAPTWIRRASDCGEDPTAATSPRSAWRARPICSPPAWISTASTIGATRHRNGRIRDVARTAFKSSPMAASRPGDRRCC